MFDSTYHLEGVELFLDLLCKHRGKPVAGCDVSPTVVVLRRPCIVKLNTWAKSDISLTGLRCSGETSRASIWYARCFGKVVLIAKRRSVIGRARRIGLWSEIRSGISRPKDG